MKDGRGNEYGPVAKQELDQWVLEGRVTAASQVMSSEVGQWVYAGAVYQALRQPGQPHTNPYGETGYPGNTHPGNGYPANGYPANGYPANGYPANGYPANGYPGTSYPRPQSDKSKIVAVILGLFLGWLGVHRFYLGYPLIGCLMLLTGGLCMVWSLIDTMLVLIGSVRDSEGRPLAD